MVQTHMYLVLQEIESRDDLIIADLAAERQVHAELYTQLKQLKEAKRALRRCNYCQRSQMRRFIPADTLPTL